MGAMDPAGITVFVEFFFPDRKAFLYFIDKIPRSEKGRITMSGCHANPNRNITDFKLSRAVNGSSADDFKFFKLN